MNANRYFSFSRLGLVMKRDFMENWKTNLYRFLGAYCGFLILMFIGYLSADSFISFSELVYRGYASVLIIGGFFWASIIMEPMNTQQNRASFLMLPASSLEKFIARTLYVTLGFFGLMTAGLLMAEVSRFLLLPLFDLPEDYSLSILPLIWQQLTEMETMKFVGEGAEESYQISILAKVWGALALGWIYSFFIWGGCYWRKHAFWKTWGVIILISNLIGFLLVGLVQWLEDCDKVEAMAEWVNSFAKNFTFPQVLWCCIIVQIFLVILNWWLSYRCFTRSQVIKPKFRLL